MPKRKAQEEDISLSDEEGDEQQEVDAGEAPTSINPYHVLDLPVDASSDEVKKAYRKAALKSHPDKVSDEHKDAAHKRFQEVAFAYAILSDERRRKRYDTTGRTEESLDIEDDDFDWTDFFRAQFANVTEERINEFVNEYKGSDEERRAVLAAYEKHEGNMFRLYNEVMMSDMTEDDERFRAIIDQAIEDGEVEEWERYSTETEKKRKERIAIAQKIKDRESKEAEQLKEEMAAAKKKKAGKKAGKDAGGFGDLAALIQQRQQGRQENFFDNLEAKYASKGKKGKGMAADGPSEEAFAANRKKGDAVEGARKKSRTRK